jgi:rhodanese-related sulfurtransferase
MQEISAPELAALRNSEANNLPIMLDVREPWEYETCHIPGVLLMPMRTVPQRWQELDKSRPVVCICHHGGRSMQVAGFLEQQGFQQVINLTGGVHAWASLVDPTMPTY